MNDNSKKTDRLIESGKVVDHNQRVESDGQEKLKTCLDSDLSGVPLAPAPAPTPALLKRGGSWYETKAFPANAANQYPYLGRFSEGTSRVLH